MRVTCKVDDVEVYKDFHAFIVPKKIHSSLDVTPVPQVCIMLNDRKNDFLAWCGET